jgi:precorrin-8X/cobalt-precorrin-8 methylmutase
VKPEMQQLTAQGRSIESTSFAIIDQEIGPHDYTSDEWPIVRRLIHTTGDLEFARLVHFSADAVQSGLSAIRQGCRIICDVSMIQAGLSARRYEPFGCQCDCLISDPDVIATAQRSGETRAIVAMREAARRGWLDGSIIAIGNAPTALLTLLELAARPDGPKPALVLGMPVGFVSAAESKDALMAQDLLPYIAISGRKGGSPLVVAALHALLIEASV